MKRATLNDLVAPDTGAALTIDATNATDDDVREATLQGADGTTYRLREGIPSFVSEDVASDQTVKSFGQKWDKHRYYRKHTARFYTDWYINRYDLGDLDGFRKFLSDKHTILDAGTGAGRDAANFADNAPHAKVFGVDTAWAALLVASQEEGRPNVNLVHADVNRLPFPDEYFDFINCDQVIHHTPDPPLTFQNLRKKLKTGGTICTYVYAKKSVIREFTDDYVRERIKDMSFEEALEVCDGITKLGKALADLKVEVDVPDDIPVLGIKKGKMDVQRWVHWNVMKCFWNDEFDFFTNNVVNVDWYHPVYCFRYTPEEFRAWFDEGWEIEAWDVQEAGISCRARKI
ncbi:MAG: class I SAM-dependent methyltransferase [Myxococcales bacterium]|nr:class I SAM-dependent methyltransferase [Myxococcales bacterium]